MVRDCTTIEEHYRESLDFLEKFESRNLSFENPVGKSFKRKWEIGYLKFPQPDKGNVLKNNIQDWYIHT